MITFDAFLDHRTREQDKPCIAKLKLHSYSAMYGAFTNTYYIIIGTEYGALHKTNGDLYTWDTYGGAYKALNKKFPSIKQQLIEGAK